MIQATHSTEKFDDRTRSFSLTDFHDFQRCPFRFFVKHPLGLGKKYELEKGSASQALGSLLDLTIKKIHKNRLYHQPVGFLQSLIKAAEKEMRDKVVKVGVNSFYGAQIPFLTPETIEKAQTILKDYYQGVGGKIKPLLSINTFWEQMVDCFPDSFKVWGGPDVIEAGEEEIPEVVDYKCFENHASAKNLDMDLMPKVYMFLASPELKKMGFNKAKFVVRLWLDPGNDAYFKEFNLTSMPDIERELKELMEKIMTTTRIEFCEREYCPACQSDQRETWLKSLQEKGLS